MFSPPDQFRRHERPLAGRCAAPVGRSACEAPSIESTVPSRREMVGAKSENGLARTLTFGALLIGFVTVTLVSPLVSPMMAQPPRGPRPWWDGEVAKNANLTDAQQKQFVQIQHDFRPRMREVQEGVRRADAEVAAAFNEEPVDQTKANAAIEKLATAHAELTRALSQMDLKLRTVLTAQQWQEMNRHQRNWPQDRPGRGRRGPATTSTTTQQK